MIDENFKNFSFLLQFKNLYEFLLLFLCDVEFVLKLLRSVSSTFLSLIKEKPLQAFIYYDFILLPRTQ